jgi:hypothetical protein
MPADQSNRDTAVGSGAVMGVKSVIFQREEGLSKCGILYSFGMKPDPKAHKRFRQIKDAAELFEHEFGWATGLAEPTVQKLSRGKRPILKDHWKQIALGDAGPCFLDLFQRRFPAHDARRLQI